jgi:hypothetical protein
MESLNNATMQNFSTSTITDNLQQTQPMTNLVPVMTITCKYAAQFLVLISRNPRERMFKAQTSLLIVIFLSLISQNLSVLQTIKEVNPHPCIAPCVNMWSVTFLSLSLSFFFLCHLLNVGACVRQIAREGQVEWTTPA